MERRARYTILSKNLLGRHGTSNGADGFEVDKLVRSEDREDLSLQKPAISAAPNVNCATDLLETKGCPAGITCSPSFFANFFFAGVIRPPWTGEADFADADELDPG